MYYLKLITVFIGLISFVSSNLFAAEIENNYNLDSAVVGFLQTEKETYAEELTFSHNIAEMLTKLGAKVVLIDYNKIVDFKNINLQSRKEAEEEKNIDLLEKIESEKIRNAVLDFIKVNKINRIFIPGNFYNLDTEPYAPTPNRQLITKAISEIVREDHNIHIIGVCGGLQGIMHAQGVEIVRVNKLTKSKEAAAVHVISMPDPHQENVHLHKLRVVPNSRLAAIVSKYVKPDENGWFSLFFPDAHGGVVNNSEENKQKLESLGYRITGFSEDGIIEAIEDKYGNIFFQDHPESLAINGLKSGLQDVDNKQLLQSKERNESTLAAIAIVYDFLYRK